MSGSGQHPCSTLRSVTVSGATHPSLSPSRPGTVSGGTAGSSSTCHGRARPEGRVLRLRAVVELESGPRAELPQNAGGLSVRLKAPVKLTTSRPG